MNPRCHARTALILLALLISVPASAQDTNAPAAPLPHVREVPQPGDTPVPGQNLTPDQAAALQKRFETGYALEKAGKLDDARKIFEGILAEQPNARLSLLEAGRINFLLSHLPKAEAYLEKLHEILLTLDVEKDDRAASVLPETLDLLIQVNQALGRDVAVELLVREFTTLHDSGKIPDLKQSLLFTRERIPFHDDMIVVSQFFDYNTDPNTVWMGEIYDATGKLKQRILLNYDPDASRALKAKSVDTNAHPQVFTWFGHDLKDGQVTTINAYLQIFALPDYNKFRSALLVILANPPKPIYSAPVPSASGGQ